MVSLLFLVNGVSGELRRSCRVLSLALIIVLSAWVSPASSVLIRYNDTFGPHEKLVLHRSSYYAPVNASTNIVAPFVYSNVLGENFCTMPASTDPRFAGKIVLTMRDRVCPFMEKTCNARKAGAVALLVGNSVDAAFYTMAAEAPCADGNVTIPSVMVRARDFVFLASLTAANSPSSTVSPAGEADPDDPMRSLGFLTSLVLGILLSVALCFCCIGGRLRGRGGPRGQCCSALSRLYLVDVAKVLPVLTFTKDAQGQPHGVTRGEGGGGWGAGAGGNGRGAGAAARRDGGGGGGVEGELVRDNYAEPEAVVAGRQEAELRRQLRQRDAAERKQEQEREAAERAAGGGQSATRLVLVRGSRVSSGGPASWYEVQPATPPHPAQRPQSRPPAVAALPSASAAASAAFAGDSSLGGGVAGAGRSGAGPGAKGSGGGVDLEALTGIQILSESDAHSPQSAAARSPSATSSAVAPPAPVPPPAAATSPPSTALSSPSTSLLSPGSRLLLGAGGVADIPLPGAVSYDSLEESASGAAAYAPPGAVALTVSQRAAGSAAAASAGLGSSGSAQAAAVGGAGGAAAAAAAAGVEGDEKAAQADRILRSGWAISLHGDMCAICLDEFAIGDLVKALPCRHAFHPACIDQWVTRPNDRPECPLCKADIISGLEEWRWQQANCCTRFLRHITCESCRRRVGRVPDQPNINP